MRKVVLVLSAFAFSLLNAASFDCKKADTPIEKWICADEILGKLDEALGENYKYTLASDIGDGARKELKKTQKERINKRDKRADIKCVEELYRSRIDDVCGYPVLLGVRAICAYSNEIDEKR
jgi:uncharacterized protein